MEEPSAGECGAQITRNVLAHDELRKPGASKHI